MSDALGGALIGIVGLLLGLIVGEYFRRRSRIEEYSKEIFFKRLEIYEVLYQKLHQADDIVMKLKNDEIQDIEELLSWSSGLLTETARYIDQHGLYINEKVAMQILRTLALFPITGIGSSWQAMKEEIIKNFPEDYKESTCILMVNADKAVIV